MLVLSNLGLDEIATALAEQTDYEHRWLLEPPEHKHDELRTGQDDKPRIHV